MARLSQIITLCIFTRNMRMLEELSRVISQVQVGGSLKDLERISAFSNERSFAFNLFLNRQKAQ